MQRKKFVEIAGLCLACALMASCAAPTSRILPEPIPSATLPTVSVPITPRQQVVANAMEQTQLTTAYDPAYVALAYPNGDVPLDRGVCADVVVRAFRAANIDLQKEVHEDMRRAFAQYPQKWGAKGTDANIDHRRVPNLMTWFARQQKHLPVSDQAADYQPGDIVAWELNVTNGQLHIGIVSDVTVTGTNRYAIIHNISSGAQLADVLFAWKIIGHYRYFTDEKSNQSKGQSKDHRTMGPRYHRQKLKG